VHVLTAVVYGWYSDNSELLQESGIYLRTGARNPGVCSFIRSFTVVLLMKISWRCRKASLQEPCRIVKPEDNTLYTDDYWLRLAEQLESERSDFVLPFPSCLAVPVQVIAWIDSSPK